MTTKVVNGKRVAMDNAVDFDATRHTLKNRQRTARLECERRLYEVLDLHSQMNLTAARAAGLLDSAQAATFQLGLGWIASMRAIWPTIALNEQDPFDDSNWPVVPAGVRELADQF